MSSRKSFKCINEPVKISLAIVDNFAILQKFNFLHDPFFSTPVENQYFHWGRKK